MKDFFVAAAALVSFAAVGAATPAIAGPAITLTTPGATYPSGSYTLGFEFTVVSPETINALGVYDDGGAPLSVPANVGIWDTSGNLLVSATVPAGNSAPLIGDFRYAASTPFTAVPGTDYVVGAFLSTGTASSLGTGQGGSGTVDPNVVIIEDRYSNFNSAFSFPDTTDNIAGGAWLGANFTDTALVPVSEPELLALLSFGLLGLGLICRRR